MVTSSQGCLTPKGHFGIDRPGPAVIEILAKPLSGRESKTRGGASEARQPSDSTPTWTTPPYGRPPSLAATQPRCLFHSCYRYCLLTPNDCFFCFFPPPSKSPSQVLPVHTSASAPAFKAITWTRNHLHTIGKSCPKQKKKKRAQPGSLSSLPSLLRWALLRCNYTERLILLWDYGEWKKNKKIKK